MSSMFPRCDVTPLCDDLSQPLSLRILFEDAENTESVEDAEDAEKTEDAKDTEDAEDAENAEDSEDAEDAENAEDAVGAEDTEDAEDSEIARDLLFCPTLQCVFKVVLPVSGVSGVLGAYRVSMDGCVFSWRFQ